MTTVDELEREFSCSREVAIAFVYKVYAWRGRSPEFMQAQVDRLETLIEKWAESHSRQLWLEAAEHVADLRRFYGRPPRIADMEKVAKDIEEWLRAKAESTPKPSPALLREEKS